MPTVPSYEADAGAKKATRKAYGGSGGICEHGRQKCRCKECGGSALCEHRRRKDRCKECGGSAYCDHGRRKRTCKECGGTVRPSAHPVASTLATVDAYSTALAAYNTADAAATQLSEAFGTQPPIKRRCLAAAAISAQSLPPPGAAVVRRAWDV